MRRSLNQWFERNDIKPRVVAELEDSALMKVFGGDGLGIFVAPSAVESEVIAQFRLKLLGRAHDVIERFYAISVERRLEHPAVVVISNAARHEPFAKPRRS